MSNLDLIASKARAYAKKENSKEAAKHKRQVNLSYDDLEEEDYSKFSDGSGVLKLIAWVAVITIFIIVTGLKLIEIWQR